MRTVWFAVAVIAFCISARGFAQSRSARSPRCRAGHADVEPPLARRQGPFRGRCTPVEIPPADPPAAPAAEARSGPARRSEVCEPKCERRGPLGPAWDSMELLLWWPKAPARCRRS